MGQNASGPKPAWCSRLVSELTGADTRARLVAGGLTASQLNWKADDATWSVAQCLDHLVMANNVYLAPIADAIENRPSATVQEITPGWFGRYFIRRFIEPSPKTPRTRAPRKIVPAPQPAADILETFLRSNEAARELLVRAAHCDVNRIRFRNPFVPGLRFTVGTGFEILSKHQQRHLLQAERVRQLTAFPASPPLTV